MTPRLELVPVPETERVQRVPFPLGELVAYTCAGPDKAENEDAAAVLAWDGAGLLVVADGMGGQNAGRRASRCTLDAITETVRAAGVEGTALRHALLDGIEAANQAVRELALGAGSTVAAIALREGAARALHVGDSFALHVGQRGRVKMLTVSHSPTGYAVEAGLLDAEEALQHEERHLVLNYVGHEGMRVEVGTPLMVAPRDTLLVASDGLSDNLTPEEIVSTVRKGSLLEAGQRLARLARERMTHPEEGAPSKPDDLTFLLFRPTRRPAHAGAEEGDGESRATHAEIPAEIP